MEADRSLCSTPLQQAADLSTCQPHNQSSYAKLGPITFAHVDNIHHTNVFIPYTARETMEYDCDNLASVFLKLKNMLEGYVVN